MDTRLLIDNIVRQTTILIAELSTAAGVRAPLAHIADQVFVDLAHAIEAQGVGRKVVADMFGITLRTYQKRTQRLAESASVRDKTLWQAVLDFLCDNGGVSRRKLFERFKYDEARDVGAVLNDLMSSGLIYVSGRGDDARYGLVPDADRRRMAQADLDDALPELVWMTIYRAGSISDADLADAVGVPRSSLEAPLAGLQGDGRISRDDSGGWTAPTLSIAVGAAAGWEAAVFDHYQAVAKAIAHKLRGGARLSQSKDIVGGATLSFDIHPDHPHESEVLALLQDTRQRINQLWEQVSSYNRAHPPPNDRTRVTFYFGQNVEGQTENGTPSNAQEEPVAQSDSTDEDDDPR